jgi:hypothetical protein
MLLSPMRIFLHLHNIIPGKPTVLGPAPWFRFQGNFIRQGADAAVVARRINHAWEAKGNEYAVIDCPDLTCIHFEDFAGGTTSKFGAFAHIRLADDILHADNKIFARFNDETQLWRCYPTENYWPIMVIAAAPE